MWSYMSWLTNTVFRGGDQAEQLARNYSWSNSSIQFVVEVPRKRHLDHTAHRQAEGEDETLSPTVSVLQR